MTTCTYKINTFVYKQDYYEKSRIYTTRKGDEMMDNAVMNEDELEATIEMLCRSKASELRLIGYERVTSRDVWKCVSHNYADIKLPQLHQLVNDILSLHATEFMNYMTVSAYRGLDIELAKNARFL